MGTCSPIDLLFGGMGKLGPGSDEDTLSVLRALPGRECRVVVDAGCGAGRQTIALAKELCSVVHAVETLKEIEIVGCSGDSYGYVIYVLQRA